MAMLKEDMWCPEAIICYGLVEPPSYFLQGHMNLTKEGGQYLKDLKAAKNYANSLPRFEVGQYIGVVSAPLTKATFTADLIMVYCDSAQLTHLIYAAAYKTGDGITFTLSGGGCIRAVIPPMKSKQYQVAIPCGGDRRWGIAQDDELIFTIPKEKIDDFREGLKANAERYPVNFSVQPEHELHAGYMRTLELLGLD